MSRITQAAFVTLQVFQGTIRCELWLLFSVVVDNISAISLIDTMDLSIIRVGHVFIFLRITFCIPKLATFALYSYSILKHICFICW